MTSGNSGNSNNKGSGRVGRGTGMRTDRPFGAPLSLPLGIPLALLAVLLTACAGAPAPPPSDARPSPRPSAAPVAAVPSVGVLTSEGDHWCTASVVDSPQGNVIATAAHCVFFQEEDEQDGYEAGYFDGDLEFAPQYSGAAPGHYPYGKWRVTGIHVNTLWRDENEDRGDYAFLTVARDARGRTLQEVVGAAVPDWTSGPRRRVTVIGYPNEDHNPGNRPVSCTTRTRRDADEPYMVRMDCAGLWSGTSGSPWLADHGGPDRPGHLIGVLSGGDTDRESVAVLFDHRARDLYERAVRAGAT
ncbi:trypsin-like serine peptidase [Streptomyces celluloflavus]